MRDIPPDRSTERFDAALCGSTVWRQRDESMANYVARRRGESSELEDGADATVSEDIQAAFVL